MGCDIHLMVEVRDKKLDQWKEYDIADELLKNIGRNYNLFSILANVRNGVGFANSDTGNAFIPIDNPRGVPNDASEKYIAYVENWGLDGHSHSFLDLAELKKYDWRGQKNKHRGFMNQKDYAEYKRTGKITRYATNVSGESVKKTANEAMDVVISSKVIPDKEADYYTLVEWEESYYESAVNFVDKVLPALEKIANDCNCENEDVRLLFFFDD
ncbi:hypothetical protein [Listeria monocytogenes]|uniref:hypothetical protein n=1 Tax=Listeria monocytogenes TaxID=1639 RepID=UPI000873C643|nr:hypothetical protein [Listeria monocytogenes]EGC8556139.1 hypothetical protein [Listeria monocytogenes]OFG12989.1 hypothetical protein BJM43_10490 [Listeria monocytogenes]